MALTTIVKTLLTATLLCGQVPLLEHAKKWKLYNISDESAFSFRIDTLKNFKYANLNEDTIKYFFSDLKELPENQPQFWQGAYIATFEINDTLYKLEISHYGGLLFDETRKRHYQIAENKIDEWLTYVRRSFLTMQKPTRNFPK